MRDDMVAQLDRLRRLLEAQIVNVHEQLARAGQQQPGNGLGDEPLGDGGSLRADVVSADSEVGSRGSRSHLFAVAHGHLLESIHVGHGEVHGDSWSALPGDEFVI